MDIQKEIEQELVFKIEIKNKEKRIRQRKVVKLASENLKKMTIDRLSGKTGEC
ncbi:MAG: hypothetical protein PHN66_01495 [Candidatus Shapirobacteria bacterium]|nr:hypothetical protein [Candidatus Shapirobacteria bacterium]